MALETATYIANLVVTNPDGSDAKSTADDHLRLIKAVLRRTFPNMDGAVSLSATQVSYIGDLSASVQAQLNALRDGSETVNFAKYANSASVAAYIGTVPASRVMDTGATNVMNAAVGEIIRATANGCFYSFYVGGVLRGFIEYLDGDLIIANATAGKVIFYVNGGQYLVVNQDGTLTIPGLISGTITNAQTASTATTATTAATATNATTATTATLATTAISASSAATLAGIAPDTAATGNTIAQRTGAGYLFANYFSQDSSEGENLSVGQVVTLVNGDNFFRKSTPAFLGQHMDARNISTKTGTAKTLVSGTGPPSLSGSTNGDIWYYY